MTKEEDKMNEKKIESIITCFFRGGTKLKASLSISRIAAEAEMMAAKKEMRDVKLETVDEDVSKEESWLYITRQELLFYNIYVPAVEPLIHTLPRGMDTVK